MDRRDFIARATAIATGGWMAARVWTVPAGATLSCSSYDVLVTYSGAVAGSHGPFRSFPDRPGCLASLQARVPLIGQQPFLTASTACAGGSAGHDCSSFAEAQQLAVDLRNVAPALDVQIEASTVRAQAVCDARTSHLGEATLVVAGRSVSLPARPAPNTTVAVPANATLVVALVLNEQPADTKSVNAAHLTVRETLTGQMVAVVLGHASGACG